MFRTIHLKVPYTGKIEVSGIVQWWENSPHTNVTRVPPGFTCGSVVVGSRPCSEVFFFFALFGFFDFLARTPMKRAPRELFEAP